MTVLDIAHKTQDFLMETYQDSLKAWRGLAFQIPLEAPYPTDVIFKINRQTTEDGDPCYGLYLVDQKQTALHVDTTSVDLLEVTNAIFKLFRLFDVFGWSPELLLDAWKNMEFHLHRDVTKHLVRPYLHFTQEHTWADVLAWFDSHNLRYDNPVMKQTVYLKKQDAEKYQNEILSVFGLDYEALGYDEDTWAACYEVSFGDNWTAELRICTGSTDEPLHTEVVLLYDGMQYSQVVEKDKRGSLLGEHKIPTFDNFVHVILDVQIEEEKASEEELEWVLPVTWEMCGKVRVKAPTLEDAIEKANTDDSVALPPENERYYVDASFAVTPDEDLDFIRQCYNGNQPDAN